MNDRFCADRRHLFLMNKQEYIEELNELIPKYKKRTYDEWKMRVVNKLGPEHIEYKNKDNVDLQVVVDQFWDDKRKETIRITFAIDDGGWRAFLPVCLSEIINPDNTYV